MSWNSIKNRFLKTLNNDFSLKIYAILLGVVAWFIISATVYPTITKHLKNLEITVPLENTVAEGLNLQVVEKITETVTIQLEGKRADIGSINKDDIQIVADASKVNKSGEYELELSVKKLKSKYDFDVINISPSTIKVHFDEIITQPFELKVEAPYITAAEGFTKRIPVSNPSIVNITGPKYQIDQIDYALVETDTRATINQSSSYNTSDIKIYNKSSTLMDTSSFTFDTLTFSIEVPIFFEKTLPFSLQFQNVPKGFNESSLPFQISSSEITLASSNTKLSQLESWPAGYINIREINIGSSFTLPIEIPSEYENVSGTESITVNFPLEGYISKKFSVNEIKIINIPSQYDVKKVTNQISNVTLIGPKSVIENLDRSDIIAEIDMSDVSVEQGSFNVPVSIIIPNQNNVWAYGDYTAAVKATKK